MNRFYSTIFALFLTVCAAIPAQAMRRGLSRAPFKRFAALAQRAIPSARHVKHRRTNNNGYNGRWSYNSHRFNWAKPSALTGVLAATLLHDDKKEQKPAFTKKNVFYYGATHTQAFIEYALENLTTQDAEIIETICEFIEQNPKVAQKLTTQAIEKFNDVNAQILRTILKHNPSAADYFAKVALRSKNSHLADIAENYRAWKYTLSSAKHDPDLAQNYLANAIIDVANNKTVSKPHASTPPMQAILSGAMAAQISCLISSNLTPSDFHTCNYRKNINSMLSKYPQQINALHELVRTVHTKEKEENAKGNYTFVHAQQWQWAYHSDMYKYIYNLTVQEQDKMGDDFIPLRFDATISDYSPNRENDTLFLNYALYGNTEWWGNSTIQLFMKKYDWSQDAHDRYSPKKFFTKFNLVTYYDRYKEEFARLQKLHTSSNIHNLGNLLMISVDDKNLSHINPVSSCSEIVPAYIDGKETNDMREIMKAYKENPSNIKYTGFGLGTKYDADWFQFGLKLNEHTLNHKTGPRMYAFNAADHKLYQEYCAARDSLFMKIAHDIEQDKARAEAIA